MAKKKFSKEETKKWKKRIYDRERRFQAMTDAQKRVAIAKDVIAQLESGLIIKAKSGTYFASEGVNKAVAKAIQKSDDDWLDDIELDLRDVLVSEQPTCSACAVGSMFICATLRQDNFNVVGDDIDRSSMEGQLTYFEPDQLWAIEDAFESSWKLSDEETMTKGEESDKKRLIAIMQNIIDNKGTFDKKDRSRLPKLKRARREENESGCSNKSCRTCYPLY